MYKRQVTVPYYIMQTFSLGLFDGGYAGGIDLSLEEVLFLALFSDVLQPVFGDVYKRQPIA